eukprot:EG_transcript_12704
MTGPAEPLPGRATRLPVLGRSATAAPWGARGRGSERPKGSPAATAAAATTVVKTVAGHRADTFSFEAFPPQPVGLPLTVLAALAACLLLPRPLPWRAVRPRRPPAIAALSTASADSPIHRVGDMAQEYEITAVVGRNGRVYEARKAAHHKVFLRVTPMATLGPNWQQWQRYDAEVKALLALQHPCIPRYREAFDVEVGRQTYRYLVQKKAPGRSLADWVQSGWRPTEVEVCAVALQVLDALCYVGRFRPPVLHGNVEPTNVFLQRGRAEDLRVALVNFVSPLGCGVETGTYGYLAPEQFKGQLTPQSDIYGLGCTILFLLSAQPPSSLPDQDLHLRFDQAVTVSPALAAVLRTMLQPEPRARYATAEAAAAALAGAKADLERRHARQDALFR